MAQRDPQVRFQSLAFTGNADATTVNELVNEYHRPLAAPNTFHLDGLLSGLTLPDQIHRGNGRQPLVLVIVSRKASHT